MGLPKFSENEDLSGTVENNREILRDVYCCNKKKLIIRCVLKILQKEVCGFLFFF